MDLVGTSGLEPLTPTVSKIGIAFHVGNDPNEGRSVLLI